jgi:simple sugar transport system ATP-binding protein
MSGGNQQKAIVAREIDLENQLIIFVQPTRGLDIAARAHIHRQIMEERARGHAILLVSLELDEVMELADTIAVVYNGSLRKVAPSEDLSLEEVGRLMLGVGA